jgi:hypothetical protein
MTGSHVEYPLRQRPRSASRRYHSLGASLQRRPQLTTTSSVARLLGLIGHAVATSTPAAICHPIRPNHAHPPVTDAGEARLGPDRASRRGTYGREVAVAREVAARPRVPLPWIGRRGLRAARCHVRDPFRFWSQQSCQNGSKTWSRGACGSSWRE